MPQSSPNMKRMLGFEGAAAESVAASNNENTRESEVFMGVFLDFGFGISDAWKHEPQICTDGAQIGFICENPCFICGCFLSMITRQTLFACGRLNESAETDVDILPAARLLAVHGDHILPRLNRRQRLRIQRLSDIVGDIAAH